ncbi:glycoside hydrolase family 127 protein [Flavobacterium sp. LHD-80]|uniref:beta-L-arabinofuranosidase domain-containing protein n=1 Tax=Flavobacterium sp. LHD-80 TaxID=3071411 RepID=UPI0027E1E554|nr:beta-L-arabinofuranosidase domain-containing protein [Flavobacterium sp. LHD-80]MDQ6473009.1 glycoside hydrolase family 127 protein [Flavobacterium sp. LHD-80]
MKNIFFKTFGIILFCSGIQAQQGFVVSDKVKYKTDFFQLNEVRLLDSKFKNAMDKDAAYLLALEPDRLLSRFREYAGLSPKGKIYGGWEARGISGHSLGHYLTAVSLMYAATGDQRFKDRADYIVSELLECQKKKGTGYIGAIPDGDKIFNEVAAGNIKSQGFDLNGGWVPWYTQHKVLAGLVDAYMYTGNKNAKEIAVAFSDWIDVTFKNLTKEQFQKMLDCEHGGMNEALANVYAITGNKKYLELSQRFYHEKVLNPLENQKDELAGLHANTQIPKVIGTARDYELTGNPKMHTVSDFFWKEVVNHHSYVIGGNSNYEHFGARDKLADQLSPNTTETCNSYNMLKLTEHLYKLDPSSAYMDFYERVIYNHILPSQNPENGMVLYYFPLKSGEKKIFGTPDDSFWCCTGTGMENHAKYGEAIYAKGNQGDLYINLFIPSTLNWKEKGLKIKQTGNFPESNKVTFTIEEGSFKNKIYLRVPDWAINASVKINGKKAVENLTSGSYFVISGNLKKGDIIEYTMPMNLHQQAMPDDQNKVAMLYRPVVLAGELGTNTIKAREIPVLVTNDNDINNWLKISDENKLKFTIENTQKTSLVPLYSVIDNRYMVYWNKFSTDEWKVQKAVFEKQRLEEEALEARTLDHLRIGEMQPERDHEFEGKNTFTGEFQNMRWRDARDGGYFSFTMETKNSPQANLICTYFGSDGGKRSFSILVDGIVIAKEVLKSKKPNSFYDETYVIPKELVSNKTKITIKFLADQGNTAGGLFDCRLVKPENKN